MASRLRGFIRLQSIYQLKKFSFDQGVLRKPHILLYGTDAKPRFFSKTLVVIGGLAVVGGVYGYLIAPSNKTPAGVQLNEKSYVVRYEIPDIKPSREVQGPFTDIDFEFTLYQYQNCPFCCKVRAFLDYHGIPYKVIEVNPVMRQQLKFSDYKKVPILIAKDKKTSVKYQLNDSSVIVSILGTYLLDPKNKLEDVIRYYAPYVYTDENGKRKEEVLNTYFLMFGDVGIKGGKKHEELVANERKWRKWADSDLVHILSPNIYRSYDEALQAFNYFSDVGEWEHNFKPWERLFVIYVGATAMYFIGKRLKKRHGLKDDVRQSLYDACNHWLKSVGSKRKFMGGDVPNLADLAVYGLLHSIEGCLAFKELLEKTNIGPWYFGVKEAVSNHTGYQLLQ